MKLALICNNKVALPALDSFVEQGVDLCVATSAANTELYHALQPYSLKYGISLFAFDQAMFEEQLYAWLDSEHPDVVLMMTCPFKIPEPALLIPRYGFINFHYGLLPAYRGPNPVFEQIKRREQSGGITVHIADKGIDTGAIIMKKEVLIGAHETFGDHMGKLALVGAGMAAELLSVLSCGKDLDLIPQDNAEAAYYPRPDIEDVKVQWKSMPAEAIEALTNACMPWNYGAATALNGGMIGISKVTILHKEPVATFQYPGTILTIDPQNGLRVLSADRLVLRLDTLYAAGNFIPGHQLAAYGIMPGMFFN